MLTLMSLFMPQQVPTITGTLGMGNAGGGGDVNAILDSDGGFITDSDGGNLDDSGT